MLGEPRYQYAATFLNIKEWRGKICGKALETLTQTHVVHYTPNGVPSTITKPPWIAFERKKARAPEYEWQPLKSDGKTAAYDLALNKVQSYQWSWHTTEPSDYRIVVRYAMPKDQFDFMMDKR